VYTERGLGNPKWKSREFAAAFSAVIVLGLGPRVTLAKAPKGSARESNAAKRAQIREGASLFRGNCSPCHGLYAQGGGRGPDLSSGRWVHGSTDADIFHTITQGVPGTEMPANSFEDSEIRALIAYLRSLRPSSKPAASAPERGTHDGCASSAGMPFPTPWLARSAPAHPRAVASLVAQRLHERSARAGSMHAVLRVPPPPRAAFRTPASARLQPLATPQPARRNVAGIERARRRPTVHRRGFQARGERKYPINGSPPLQLLWKRAPRYVGGAAVRVRSGLASAPNVAATVKIVCFRPP